MYCIGVYVVLLLLNSGVTWSLAAMIIDGWLSYLQVNRLASIYIDIVLCHASSICLHSSASYMMCAHTFQLIMPHIQSCSHKRERVSYVYISSRFCPTIKNFLATPLLVQLKHWIGHMKTRPVFFVTRSVVSVMEVTF